MKPQNTLVAAMFFALVPVTLLVPGLRELVQLAHGGTAGAAHAFMTVNMAAGIVAVPFTLRALRRWPNLRGWLCAALLLDALAFLGMGSAPSLGALFVFRVVDGMSHLPAITLLMVAANRVFGVRPGAAMGALAASLMAGVAVGSPLGGWLVGRGAWWVYGTGAGLLAVAAGLSWGLAGVAALPAPAQSRSYSWNWRAPATWVPLGYGFMDRFSIGVFVSTFTLFLGEVRGLGPGARGALVAVFMVPFALLCYPAGRLADARGWWGPMLTGNIGFGVVFALYGVAPVPLLPLAMVLSGVFSALMFAPNLVLISHLARHGYGEGLFGAFQIAGSLGFLIGPIVGGVLVAATSSGGARPEWEKIFALVGVLEFVLAAASFTLLRRVARDSAPSAAVSQARS